MAKLTVAFVDDLIKQVTRGDISFSRMVELLNEGKTAEPRYRKVEKRKWCILSINLLRKKLHRLNGTEHGDNIVSCPHLSLILFGIIPA